MQFFLIVYSLCLVSLFWAARRDSQELKRNMKHRLEYRIGAIEHEVGTAYNVYACIVLDGEVKYISKYPVSVREFDSMEKMKEEIALYSNAVNMPVFDRNAFGVYQYFTQDWGSFIDDGRDLDRIAESMA